ncbi:MAG: DUF5317 domain-containing protein [Armatimonadota bacterium]|nr:MAG: DUF5317 domain-containing protein [Armatimonadota bacterium]
MLFDGAVLGIVIALIAGGRFSRLGRLDLRWPWVFVAAFGVRAVIVVLGVRGWQPVIGIAPALHILSYVLLLAAVVANRHLWAMWVAALGVAMNFAVIAANGGTMPADADLVGASGQQQMVQLVESGRYPTHTLLDAGTRLPFLADRYLLPHPYPRPSVFSLGDILITLGVVVLIMRGMGAFGWGWKQRDQAQQSRGGPAPREEHPWK